MNGHNFLGTTCEMNDIENQERPVLSVNHSSQHELHRILFEEAADGMFITDPDWRYLTANPRFAEMTGFPHQELLKLTYIEMSTRRTSLGIRSPQKISAKAGS
jgi:PAS domain-containing protein